MWSSLQFGADGLGSVDDRAFIWRISESGRLVISMIDGTGSIELTKQVAYSDGVVSVLSRVYTETESYFYDSLAVKVDSIGLSEAISYGRFEEHAIVLRLVCHRSICCA